MAVPGDYQKTSDLANFARLMQEAANKGNWEDVLNTYKTVCALTKDLKSYQFNGDEEARVKSAIKTIRSLGTQAQARKYTTPVILGSLLNVGAYALLGPVGIATVIAVDVVALSYLCCGRDYSKRKAAVARPAPAVRQPTLPRDLEELAVQEALRRSSESAKNEEARRAQAASVGRDLVDPATAQAIEASLTTQDPTAREADDLERVLAESAAEAKARAQEEKAALAAGIAASVADQGVEVPAVGSGDELAQAIADSLEEAKQVAIETGQLLFMTVDSHLKQPAKNETLFDTMNLALETNKYVQLLETAISSLAEFQVTPLENRSKGKGKRRDGGAGVGGYGEEENYNVAPTSLPSLINTLRSQRKNLETQCKELNAIIATEITNYINGRIELNTADIRSLANYYNITETDLIDLANSTHLFTDRLGELRTLVLNKNDSKSIKIKALINELHG